MTLLRNNTTVNHSQNVKWKSKHKIIYIYIVKILHYIKKTGKSNIKMFIVVISWCLELQTFFFLTVPFSVFQILFFFYLSHHVACGMDWICAPSSGSRVLTTGLPGKSPKFLMIGRHIRSFYFWTNTVWFFLFFSKKGREQEEIFIFQPRKQYFKTS